MPTQVADYRYKRTNSTHIYKYAEYELKPGDAWKSADDPVLLARADDWLKHGAEYTVYVDSAQPGEGLMAEPQFPVREASPKKWLLRSLLALILISAAAIGLSRRNQRGRAKH